MGTFKQIWAENFTKNTQIGTIHLQLYPTYTQPVTSQLMLRLPDGTWVPYIPSPTPPLSGAAIQAGLCTPPMAPTCRHEWKDVPGIYKVYSNCKHCGIGKEVAEGNATPLLGKETLT